MRDLIRMLIVICPNIERWALAAFVVLIALACFGGWMDRHH